MIMNTRRPLFCRALALALFLLPLLTCSQSVSLNCSLCGVDEAAVPQDLPAIFQFGDSMTTCGDAYNLGSVVLSEAECNFLQSIGESLCLCNTPLVSCDLCPDGSAPNDLSAIGNFGEITTTCYDIYNNGPVILPEANCTFLQGIGSSLCFCNKELPSVNNCTLCEDTTVVPNVLLESFPDETCAAMQNEARRDEGGNCVHYQAVIGHYCGCINPDATKDACRICGSDLLDPQVHVDVGGGSNVSCIELEFKANVDGAAACAAAQNSHSEMCCPTLAPVPAPTSSGHRLASSYVGLQLMMMSYQLPFFTIMIAFCGTVGMM